MRWLAAVSVGIGLAVAAALFNHVPSALNEVGLARADRSGTAQAAEFVSLILDSGWAWAATAVLAGRLAGPKLLSGALGGSLSLGAAVIVYDTLKGVLADGSWWGQVRTFWVVGGLILGLFLGAIGALTRRPGVIGTAAALVVPAGAALAMVVDPPAAESPAAGWVTASVWAVAVVAAGAIVVVPRYRRAA